MVEYNFRRILWSIFINLSGWLYINRGNMVRIRTLKTPYVDIEYVR